MKNVFTSVLSFLFLAVLVLLVFTFGFAIVVGILYLLAWLLRLLLPLTLYESLILGALGTIVTLVTGRSILGFLADSASSRSNSYPSLPNSEWNEPPLDKIATSRFYKSEAERTWENWFSYEIANDIYADFQIDPEPVKNLNDSQRQELAIRLAALGVAILKRKNAGSKNLEININALRREMERIGQKVYDADILSVAVDGINANVEYYSDELSAVISQRAWNQQADELDE